MVFLVAVWWCGTVVVRGSTCGGDFVAVFFVVLCFCSVGVVGVCVVVFLYGVFCGGVRL